MQKHTNMNFNEIDRLLEHYLGGETSLDEEKTLRDFFSQKDLPDKYKPFTEMFQACQAVASGRLNDRGFEKQWSARFRGKSTPAQPIFSASRWYLITGIAATVLLAIILFVPVQRLPGLKLFSQKIDDTFDDPRQAYQETIKALLIVSEKFNAGTDQAKDLGKLDLGLQKAGKMLTMNRNLKDVGELDRLNADVIPVGKLSKMDEGIQETEKLSKFNEDQLKINNL